MDGIKFLIDLDSRTAGANAADTALARVEASAHGANRSLGEMGEHGRGLSQDIFKAEFAMEALKKGAELAWEGVHKVAELIKDTITEVADERREKMAITNLLGGEEDAEKALHYLDRFNSLSEFGEKQTKAMGIELLNAGYKGQEWQDALAGIADAASMSSNKMAGAEGALSSFMRMKETGKLDARILRGLHLNVKDVVKGLGDALGMSPAAVKKGLLEGSIPAAKAYETVLRAIEKKTGKGLGEAGLVAGKGLEAKLTHLKELPEKIMKSVSDSPGMDKIEHAFDRALDALDPEGPKGAKMVKGLSSLMDSVGTVLEKTDWVELTMQVGGIATTIGTWVGPLAKVAEQMVRILDVAIKIPGALAGLGDRIGDFFGERGLQWQREQMRTTKNRGLAGEVISPEHTAEAKAESKKQWIDEQWEARQASLKSKDLPVGILESSMPVAPYNRMPDTSSAANMSRAGDGGTHIEGKAEVTVHVHGGSKASPEEIGHAAKKGVEAGLTTALEQQALHAGTRSARKR